MVFDSFKKKKENQPNRTHTHTENKVGDPDCAGSTILQKIVVLFLRHRVCFVRNQRWQLFKWLETKQQKNWATSNDKIWENRNNPEK
jgi:hypothetical protein